MLSLWKRDLLMKILRKIIASITIITGKILLWAQLCEELESYKKHMFMALTIKILYFEFT